MWGNARAPSGRYAPLLSIALAAFLALAVLPSALNLPQTNPATTLEYAPVPPSDENAEPPPGGNLASLGLATSGSLGTGDGTGDGPGLGGAAGGAGLNPRTKRCVGKPPRQTEDPLSPPCVAFFQGNNFGGTYSGVSDDEIRIVMYFECCNGPWTGTSRGEELDPGSGAQFDLAKPGGDESVWVRFSRVYQRYFNDRYQTYGRFAHFWVYFGHGPNTPESRRADAADLYAKIKPFAVVSVASEGNEDVFLEEMAKRGVLVFGARMGREASFFQRYAKHIWGYMPSIELQVDQFATYVCTKVIGHPVSFSGNGDHGKARKLGLLYTIDTGQPGMRKFAAATRKRIEACGGRIAAEGSFKKAGYQYRANEYDAAAVATANIATFRDAGVTTIIWPQGYEVEHSRAAARANYRPEWVVAGDGSHDGYSTQIWQDQTVWQHAVTVTNATLTPPLREQQCYIAQKDADPAFPEADASYGCRGTQYEDLRQLFTGIQVAGPRLNPDSIDKGFHAIPSVESQDPALPACFYEPGDYTCVKDASSMWWDPNSQSSGGTTGVWRMFDGGRRYLAGRWPAGDVVSSKRPDDPPNSFVGTYWFCC